MSELLKLAEQVDVGAGFDNALDVLIEIALFTPNTVYSAVRSNAAGTKVIYTDRAGNEVTCWSEDWTADRPAAAAALRAHDSDTRRMAETGTGSVRSMSSAGPKDIAQ